MIRVAIVEEHEQELEGLVNDLSSEKDIAIVATARTLNDARTVFPTVTPDIVITDLAVADAAGSALIVELRTYVPQSKLLIRSAFDDYERIYSAILAGAEGYLVKSETQYDLPRALRDIQAGGAPMSSAVAKKVLQAFHAVVKPSMAIGLLTEREQEVLHLLATGRSYKDIAGTLSISHDTVRTHVRNIYRKLHVHTWSDIRYADLYRLPDQN